MSEPSTAQQMPDIPEAIAARNRHWSLPLVWIIPLLAALIGGGLAVKAILDRGPAITINFKTAEGLEAGKTRIKFKEVDIGLVKAIDLSDDRASVIVTAELKKKAETLLVDDTRFWVVRPRVAAGGVSGLGTLLAGSYIGMDAGKSERARWDFTGLEVPPLVTGDLPGRQFVLQADDLGSLEIGSPVYFRRVEVGRVVAFELGPDGSEVTLKIFVNAPYDKYVTSSTRFWHASGIDLSFDASGVKINTESLTTLILGGIAFQTPAFGQKGSAAEEGTVFTLFSDRTLAMKRPDLAVETYVLVFHESVRGLSVGAEVDFRGVVIGEVSAIQVDYDDRNKDIAMAVEVSLYPDRLARRARQAIGGTRTSPATLEAFVARGFRAQLRTGSLISGQLYIAFDFFPGAAPVKLDLSKRPLELPTIPGSLQELQESVVQIVKKLDKVPLDQISRDLRRTLHSLGKTLDSMDSLVKGLDRDLAPEARSTLADARRTFAAAERTLAADAPLQHDAREALREVARAAQALRALADTLERRPEALIRGKKDEAP
jgi:paraquat-inducible protein B